MGKQTWYDFSTHAGPNYKSCPGSSRLHQVSFNHLQIDKLFEEASKKPDKYFASFAAMLEFLGVDATESIVEESPSPPQDTVPQPSVKVICYKFNAFMSSIVRLRDPPPLCTGANVRRRNDYWRSLLTRGQNRILRESQHPKEFP